MDDDADAKMILMSPPSVKTERYHQGVLLSRGWTPSSESENLQPHTERSSRAGPEPSSVEADVSLHMALRTLSGALPENKKYHAKWLAGRMSLKWPIIASNKMQNLYSRT